MGSEVEISDDVNADHANGDLLCFCHFASVFVLCALLVEVCGGRR